MLEQKFCSRRRVSSSANACHPRVIRLPSAGSRRWRAFGVEAAQAVPSELPTGPSADEHSNGMAAAINFGGRGRFLRRRSLKSELRTWWAPSPERPLHRREGDGDQQALRHEFPRRASRVKASHCSLADWWNRDVPGGTDCSHLQDHFAVPGPCIMRCSRGFGMRKPDDAGVNGLSVGRAKAPTTQGGQKESGCVPVHGISCVLIKNGLRVSPAGRRCALFLLFPGLRAKDRFS